MSWQTSYTETGLRLGAGPPVRPAFRHLVLSILLSLSFSVPGRHLKRGGSPPFLPALGSHSRVATKRRVGFRSPASHTRVATGRAERDAPTPIFCLFVCLFFFFFFFGGGGGAGVEGEGLGVGVFSGGEVLGPGFWVEWGV